MENDLKRMEKRGIINIMTVKAVKKSQIKTKGGEHYGNII